MSKAVYIGGFGAGKESANGVAAALGRYYNSVQALTFSRAMADTDALREIVAGKDVVTHGAGMLAVLHTSPRSVHAFGAPLPTPLQQFPARIFRHNRQQRGRADVPPASHDAALRQYDADTLREMWRHPWANWRHVPAMARFDAIGAGLGLVEQGVDVSLIYGREDRIFRPAPDRLDVARHMGMHVMTISGGHHELLTYPETALKQVYGPPPAPPQPAA